MKKNNGLNILLISGNSYTGKSSLSKMLCNTYPDMFTANISTTTRKPRDGERNGVDYHFISPTAIKGSSFYESTFIGDNFYGSDKKELFRAMKENKILIMIKDPLGIDNMYTKNDLPIESMKHVHFNTSHKEIIDFISKDKTINTFKAIEIEDRLDRYDFDKYAKTFNLEERADLLIKGFEFKKQDFANLIVDNLYALDNKENSKANNKKGDCTMITEPNNIKEIRTIESREETKKSIESYYRDDLIPVFIECDVSDTQEKMEKSLVTLIAEHFNSIKKDYMKLLDASDDMFEKAGEKEYIGKQLNIMFNSIDIELPVEMKAIEICSENEDVMRATLSDIADVGGKIGGMHFTQLENENEAVYFVPTIKDAIENSVLTPYIGEEKSTDLISFFEKQQEKHPATAIYMKKLYVHLETVLDNKEIMELNAENIQSEEIDSSPSLPHPHP